MPNNEMLGPDIDSVIKQVNQADYVKVDAGQKSTKQTVLEIGSKEMEGGRMPGNEVKGYEGFIGTSWGLRFKDRTDRHKRDPRDTERVLRKEERKQGGC